MVTVGSLRSRIVRTSPSARRAGPGVRQKPACWAPAASSVVLVVMSAASTSAPRQDDRTRHDRQKARVPQFGPHAVAHGDHQDDDHRGCHHQRERVQQQSDHEMSAPQWERGIAPVDSARAQLGQVYRHSHEQQVGHDRQDERGEHDVVESHAGATSLEA